VTAFDEPLVAAVAPSLRSLNLSSLPRQGRLLLVAAGVLVVGLVVGILIGIGVQSGPAANHVGEITQVLGTGDGFDRVDDPGGIGSQAGGPRWRTDGGQWRIVGGKAAATPGATGRTFAVAPIDAGDGALQVRLDKVTDGAGLVFRYRDPLNYWSVVAAPHYATWSVTKTVRGLTSPVVGTGLTSTKDGTTVAVRMKADTIDVVIGGRVRKTITDRTLAREGLGGMTVSGQGGDAARFDDFHAARTDHRPLAAPATTPASAAPLTTVVGAVASAAPTTPVPTSLVPVPTITVAPPPPPALRPR
jgi:hypothetical protein